MKLFYWHSNPNFGDLLNPWIWERLLPWPFDEGEDGVVFVGIGTVLGAGLRYQHFPRKLVMGSGAGYGALPQIDAGWKFYCVRGPHTAARLQLDPALAVTDPALLVRSLYRRPSKKPGFRYGFMPHWHHHRDAWRCVAEDVGARYINPMQEVDRVLAQISDCEVLITEAMHGAIVADAIGVPWIPAVIDDQILDFKWRDWCATVRLEYQPVRLPRLFELPPDADFVLRQHTRGTRFLARRALRRVMRASKPRLSPRTLQAELEGRLREKIALLEDDVATGSFQMATA